MIKTVASLLSVGFLVVDAGNFTGSETSCTTPAGSGTCKDVDDCEGTSYAGYCPGASNIQCCVTGERTGVYGVDLADYASTSTYSCLKEAGYDTFTIPRGFRSTGAVDTNVCSNLKNAKSAGITYRDVYMFPCPTCSTGAAGQMSMLLSYINANCADAWSGRVWLDIEGSQYWFSSTSSNKAWYEDLVDSCGANGIKCGVYSSSSQWSAIFGSTSYSYGSENPLWYAHYDNNPSFSDFSSFAGWKEPYAKQYMGDKTVCSFDVDTNYAPMWD